LGSAASGGERLNGTRHEDEVVVVHVVHIEGAFRHLDRGDRAIRGDDTDEGAKLPEVRRIWYSSS
jgi:hypothetical protein